MNNHNLLGSWIKRFLLEYLVNEKNLSMNTQYSYRDAFRLCIPFLAKKLHKRIDQLVVEDISIKIIKEFLLELESNRKCCIATRNQRLAALICPDVSRHASLNITCQSFVL
jgi:site-specific recombinase XerD